MDSFETPYEEEPAFIDCTICDKSIRGETLYKIHLTTPGHRKKEDALVASGRAVRHRNLPAFENILQYLDYVKLDEPIIGLSHLDELPTYDPVMGPKYTCRLCHQKSNMLEMVHHLIGRKHRQKYVELKRPDLVTWSDQSIMTHGGKIIRARAEIIERQDGRGTPVVLARQENEGILNASRVGPRSKQNRDWNLSNNLRQRDVPLHPYPAPPFHPKDPYMGNRNRLMYRQEDMLSLDSGEEEPPRPDYSDLHRREYMDPNYRSERYEEECFEDPQRRAALESDDDLRYSLREEMPHGQAEYFPEEAPPYRMPHPKRDALKEFYTEEVRRRSRERSGEFPPLQPPRPQGNNQRWALDRESGRPDGMNRAGRPGSSESEGNWRSFPAPVESDWSADGHLCDIIKDYCHEMREPQQEEAVAISGPGRMGPPTSQRQAESTRSLSDIPEPFRRFLNVDDRGQGKRKRKSRFSDATVEEMETTKEMFSDDYGPPSSKFGGRPPTGSPPFGPEIHGPPRPDFYVESQSLRHTESYQREDDKSQDVFHMLDNIEIENAEEANFLKSKLCNLLKEFKTKKTEKAVQHSQGRGAMSEDYNDFSPELSPRHQYDAPQRDDSDLRPPEDLYLQEDYRGDGWQRSEHVSGEHLQDYQHPVRGAPRQSSRSQYEDVFGRPRSREQPAPQQDEPAHYSERFPAPSHHRDYPPAAGRFAASRSPAPLHYMKRGPGVDRAPRYSKNLDKITSTLLELVARK